MILQNIPNTISNGSDLRMGSRGAAKLDEMSPLTQIGHHNNLGLEAVRQNRPSNLRGASFFDHPKIGVLCILTGTSPYSSLRKSQTGGLDERALVPEFVFAIVAVPGGLLTIAGESMAYYLMSDAAVCDNSERGYGMFKHCVVAGLPELVSKEASGFFSDLIFRLIARAPGSFYLLLRVFGNPK
jgi:hypothetical protein